MSWQRQGHCGSCSRAARSLHVSRQPRPGQRGRPGSCPDVLCSLGLLPLRKTVQVWLPSPEKKRLLVADKRGVSGDPVIKYTSLSCGPRNPCLKANQFPAPGGMIAVSHPETQIKRHSQTLDIDAPSQGRREGRYLPRQGARRGCPWVKLGNGREVGVLLSFWGFFLGGGVLVFTLKNQ